MLDSVVEWLLLPDREIRDPRLTQSVVSKETAVLRRRASETLSYQREADKGKLTAVASFEKVTFRV